MTNEGSNRRILEAFDKLVELRRFDLSVKVNDDLDGTKRKLLIDSAYNLQRRYGELLKDTPEGRYLDDLIVRYGPKEGNIKIIDVTPLNDAIRDYENLLYRAEQRERPAPNLDALNTKIEDLNISKRVLNVLYKNDILYIGQLVQHSDTSLLKMKDLGTRGLAEIDEALMRTYGLVLGMKLDYERSPPAEELKPEEHIIQKGENVFAHVRTSNLQGLSTRTVQALEACDINSVGDLVQRSEVDLLKTKNFGRRSLGEIKKVLSRMGLELAENFNRQEENVDEQNLEKPEEDKIAARPRIDQLVDDILNENK